MKLPIIKLTVENMTHQIATCLTEMEAQRDAMIQAELERLCSEDAIKRVIKEAVEREFDTCCREAVKRACDDFSRDLNQRIYDELNKALTLD